MFKEIVKPTLVLVLICAVVAGLLAITYNTTGVGELGNALSPEELLEYVPQAIPDASVLVSTPVSIEHEALLGVYQDEGGAGIAIHITTKGYGGELKMLIGLDANGSVTGIAITESMETNGIGTKVTDPKYLANFVGKSVSVNVQKGGAGDIDAIANATKTSQAVGTGVNSAFEIYELVKGEI